MRQVEVSKRARAAEQRRPSPTRVFVILPELGLCASCAYDNECHLEGSGHCHAPSEPRRKERETCFLRVTVLYRLLWSNVRALPRQFSAEAQREQVREHHTATCRVGNAPIPGHAISEIFGELWRKWTLGAGTEALKRHLAVNGRVMR